MTIRSLIIGILCVLLISTFGYINDNVLKLESFSNGHLLPIVVIGALLLVVLILNPLLHKLRPTLRLRTPELALIVIMSTAASGIPGRALLEQFTQTIVLPHYWYNLNPGWQTRHLLDYYPDKALVVNDDYEKVVNSFHIGTDSAQLKDLSASQWLAREFEIVPWKQWLPALRTWIPFIVLTMAAMAAMALIVHKQWADHEHLQYPLATFVSELIEQDSKHAYNAVFRNRYFWIGFLIVLALRLNNGLCQWFPEEMIPVKLNHSLAAFYKIIPQMRRNPWGGPLMSIQIFPLVTAIGFLLSAEISFTLGVSQIIWAIFCCTVVGYGFNMQTDYDIGGWQGWNRTGAYVALTLMIIFTGRFYYLNLLKKACFLPGLRSREQTDIPAPGAVNAMRIFLISTIGLCLLAIKLGLDWPFAILTILLMLVSFFVVARVSAETGLFFIQPGWQPFGAIMALFGGYAMGPHAIVISALICAVLCIDQSQALMPYLTNGLKMADRTRLNPAKVTGTTWFTYLLGIAAATVVVIICCYDVGTPLQSHWSHERLPTLPLRAVDPVVLQLQASGTLEASQVLTSCQRIASMTPNSAFLWAFGLGFFGVIALAMLRLRCKWWPLHPCLFILWATFPLSQLSNAFLAGWILKKLTLKFGGNKLVTTMKPLCFGVIAADILGVLIFMMAGAVYFFVTDEMPKTYRYFPR